MKGRKIFNMHKSKAIILPKELFKKYLNENEVVYFTVLAKGKILLEQKQDKNNGG